MKLRKYIILIFMVQCYHFSRLRNVSDIYKFVLQLRNTSASNHEYIAMIQAIFCPGQPICYDGGVEYSTDILETLPANVTIDDKTLKLEDIKDFVGVCCLPCSCSETCQEDAICCPTRYYSNDPPNQKIIKRECIAANVGSYASKTKASAETPRYFMTTKCFEDNNNYTLVSNCETPDIYNIDHTVPVTSVRSGRTYWNKPCAICNDDAENLLQWSSRIGLGNSKVIFFDVIRPGLISSHNSIEDLHVSFARLNDILYAPPVAMDSNRCLERSVPVTCAKQQETVNKTELSFLQQTCEQLYNPVYLNDPRNLVFLNIFCFLCMARELEEILNVGKCGFEAKPIEKIMSKQMSAILDYRITAKTRLAEKQHLQYFQDKQKMCSCDQFYDYNKMLCRPLLCPVGELPIGCDCIQPIKNLSGMPVSLNLKIVPKSGNFFSPTNSKVRKFHDALKKVLRRTVGNVKVDIVVTFSQEKDGSPYYLCIVVIQTKIGFDTKETLKTFIPFLDNPKSLEFFSLKAMFSVYFFTRVGMKSRAFSRYAFDIQTITDGSHADIVKLYEGDNKQNLTLIYSNKLFVGTTKLIQVLSPLMYCKQVQLDEDEFIQEDGKIIINTTSKMIHVWDFYRISPSQVRICIDKYLYHQDSSVATQKFVAKPWLCCAFFAFIYLNDFL